jgi:hypothetical protein
VQNETKERWVHICELAAREQDPDRLMMLVQELNDLLTQKHERLQTQRFGATSEYRVNYQPSVASYAESQ